MNSEIQKRKFWGDCFKALAICLVVIGHSTGKFNIYIYQFHMAAFFWISGYFTNWTRCSKKQIVWERFCTLILPTITVFLLGTLGMWLLNATNIYPIFFSDNMGYIGIKNICYQFFFEGNNYVWWMGATWFLITLFKIIFIHAILLYFFNLQIIRDKILYCVIISLFYVAGFIYAHCDGANSGVTSLAIGQLYFGVGVLCRNTYIKETIDKDSSYLKLIIGSFISVFIMVMFSNIKNITVDYPSRHFERIILNVIASINGICLLLFISKLMEKCIKPTSYIEKGIAYVGKNTLPIIYFHFLVFKVCIGILVIFGVVNINYMQNFTPLQDNIGLRFLWLFLLVSIVGSIFLWKVCNRTKLGRVLFGSERDMYKDWYIRLSKTRVISFIKRNMVDLKKYLKHIRTTVKMLDRQEKIVIAILLLLFISDGILIVRQGIILNDELKIHLMRKSDFKNVISYIIVGDLRMGRPLRILAAFNWGVDFLFTNVYLNRIVEVFIIGIAILSFFCFIIELFKQRQIAYISIGLILVFLPLTYEHGAPNAFIGLTIIPLIELCITFILWCKYMKTDRKIFFVFTMLFWLLSLGGYEFIVTYTPVFILLYLLCRNREKRNIKDLILKSVLPLLFGCAYIFLTFLFQKLYSVEYEGLTIDLSSFSAIWNVEKQICLSAVPGYFLFNSKYVYLTCFYNGLTEIMEKTGVISYDNYIDALMQMRAISVSEFKEVFNIVIHAITMPNVMLVFVFILVIGYGIGVKKIKTIQNEIYTPFYKHAFCIFSLILYFMIPILPNAISKLYQEKVSNKFFTWIPVSIFVFFTVCLFIGYIINMCVGNWRNITWTLLIFFLMFVGMPVQYMNRITSDVNNRDFERYLMIEDLFHTDCMKKLERTIVYAPDLYATKNLLAVNDGYWSEYSKICGQNMEVLRESEESNGQEDIRIFFINDKYFCIIGKEEIAVLSKSKLSNKFIVQMNNEHYEMRDESDFAYYDNGFWCYPYSIENGKLISEDRSFKNFELPVTRLDRSDVVGRWQDGWCTDEVTFKINSGEDGLFTFEGYCSEDLSDGKIRTIVVWCNKEKILEYQIDNPKIQFEIECEKNTNYDLKLTSDFLINSQNGDTRRLSYLLTNVY